MTSQDRMVHIYFVLDRSGSMGRLRDDVIGGFNAFITAQQEDGEPCLLTLVQFDTVDPYEVLYRAEPIEGAPRLDHRSFVPRGGTPLYDALGRTLADALIRQERRRAAGEPPERVLFVLFTDGRENASLEYDQQRVFKLIKRRQEDGWDFVYLGANQDAMRESGKIGLDPGSSLDYRATSEGTEEVFTTLGRSVTAYKRRRKRKLGFFTPEDT